MRRLVAALAVAVVVALTLAAGPAQAAEKAWQPPPAMQHALQECLELVRTDSPGNQLDAFLTVGPGGEWRVRARDPRDSLFQFEKCLAAKSFALTDHRE